MNFNSFSWSECFSSSMAKTKSAPTPTTYPCRVPGCQKRFTTSGHRTRHEKNSCKRGSYSKTVRYEKLPDGRFQCKNQECKLIFAHEPSFSRHLPTCGKRKAPKKRGSNLSEEPLDFSCNQCDKKFQKKSNLKRHIENVHEKAKVYKCSSCGSV